MPNPDFGALKSDRKGRALKPPSPGSKSRDDPAFVEKTANWPGLPGKAGPDRSAGIKRAKTYPKAVGL